MPKALEIEGKILAITKEEEKSGYKSKRLVILEPSQKESKYDNVWSIQVGTNNYNLLEKFSTGSHVKVYANIGSKKWVNSQTNAVSYFVTLSLWKLESQGAETPPESGLKQRAEETGFSQGNGYPAEDDSNLPF